MSTRSKRSAKKRGGKEEVDVEAVMPVAPLTPSRKKRVEEKEELQDLNKRLEFYILSQREKDAARDGAQREVEALRESFERQIEQLKQLHEAQIKVIRKNRDEKLAENAKMKEENNRQQSALESVQRELRTQKDYKADLEQRNAEMAKELQQARSKQIAAQDEVKRLQHELAVDKNQHTGTDNELKEARRRADDSTKKLSVALSKVSNLEEDFQMATDKHAKETDRYSRELAELSRNRAAVEDELRKVFARQLKEILAERQKTYEEEKAAGLSSLSDLFEEELSAKRNEIKELQGEMEELRSRNGELAAEVASLRNLTWEAQKEALESSVSDLSEKLRQTRQAGAAELSTLRQSTAKEIAGLKIEVQELATAARNATENATKVRKLEDDLMHWRTVASSLKAEIKDKDKAIKEADRQLARISTLEGEQDRLKKHVSKLQSAADEHEKDYTALLDVKVALDMEIAAYRELLAREEDRLRSEEGVSAPAVTPASRKTSSRRSTSGSSSTVVLSKEVAEEVVMVEQKEEKKSSRGKRARPSTAKKAKASAKKPAKRQKKKKEPQPESLTISEIDLDKGYVSIENVGNDEVSLDGWTVMGEKTGAVFRFPDADPLASGAELTIWLNAKSTKKGSKKGKKTPSFHWKSTDDTFDVEDDSGDACIILDPTGAVVSRCEINWA